MAPKNQRLPILKLFLSPIILGTCYGAYCYYSQQHYQKQHKIHAPIRYIQQLQKIQSQTRQIKQLKKIYILMCKHIDKFIIDPSILNEKLIDTKIQKQKQNKQTLQIIFKTTKLYEINYFNSKVNKKFGNFILGFWNNFSQITLWNIRQTKPIVDIVQKVLYNRQNKCQNIANTSANNLQGGYLQEYIQCMASTAEYAALLQRQIDIIKKFNKHQLVNK